MPVTDKNVYPEPTLPALPAAERTLTDPTFGTTILRVTDSKDGTFNTTSYSYWPSLNCNSTRLVYLSDNNGVVCDFDPVNMKVSNKRPLWAKPLPGGGQLNAEDAIWSGKDPDLIFSHQAMKIWSYNVRTNAYSLVVDLTGKAGAAVNLQQMTKSLDDNAFGFNITLGDAGGWKRVGFLVWRSPNDLYVQMTDVDEVQLDKTGKYLVVITGKQGAGVIETKVVDLDKRTVTDLTDDGPDFAPGHKDCGKGTVIGEDNWRNGVTLRRLDDPHKSITILNSGNDWSQGRHVSMLADDEGWALVSAYVVPTNPQANGPFHNEIFLVSTDGQQRVRRICHHRSVLRDYWDSPRASISRDGKFVVFTSNWGNPLRRDVFIVTVPQVSGTNPPTQPPTNPPVQPPPGPQNLTLTLPKNGMEITIKDGAGNVLGTVKFNP